MSKRDAAIYRKAARIVAENNSVSGVHYCGCNAISAAAYDALINATPYLDTFSDWFAPIGEDVQHYWFGMCWDENNRAPRVLALLFMAAISEDE